MQALTDSSKAIDLHWLGRAGITAVKGLSVAFLDGTYNPSLFKSSDSAVSKSYTVADVAALEAALQSTSTDIDLFLTCEWPDGVTKHISKEALPQALDPSGSAIVADLVTKIRPRYHVAAGKPYFFARQPYLNADLGAGSHVTRFIGLAKVGNESKQKSLHALALVPASQMDVKELQQKPADTTAIPFETTAGKKRHFPTDDSNLGVQDWRWEDKKRRRQEPKRAAPSLGRKDVVPPDFKKRIFVNNLPFTATEEDVIAFFSQAGTVADYYRSNNSEGLLHGYGYVQFETEEAAQRALGLSGQVMMGRELLVLTAKRQQEKSEPQANCWFCLSNPDADVSLIASIGDECYLACDKGQINPLHLLLLPIEHQASTLIMSASGFAEMERYLSALRSCFASQGKVLVGFERHMTFSRAGGNHCQLNVIGIPRSAESRARKEFVAAAEKRGLIFTDVPASLKGETGRKAIREVVGDGWYFLALLPDGARMVLRIDRGALNMGREVLAALAGVPDRAEWKACQVEPAEEEARTEEFQSHVWSVRHHANCLSSEEAFHSGTSSCST
eukprot:jgi/Botrbrau1/12282/Bobra.0323s0022.2